MPALKFGLNQRKTGKEMAENKKKKRDPLDRYYTPTWAAQELVKYLGDRLHGPVWEPACGGDTLGSVLRSAPGVNGYFGTDIDPDSLRFFGSRRGGCGFRFSEGWEIERIKGDGYILDFLRDEAFWEVLEYCRTIATNPPYATDDATATDFVKRALFYQDAIGCRVAMLMRIGWAEPCKDRRELLLNRPPSDMLILPRVHYIGGGKNNNQTSAWFIWERGYTGQTRLAWSDLDLSKGAE